MLSRSFDGTLALTSHVRRSRGPGLARLAIFHPEFREDLRYWVETNRKVAIRVFDLIEAVMRDPFAGIGRPEPLKYLLAGAWSRRLTEEHRIVYLVSEEGIDFLQVRYHY